MMIVCRMMSMWPITGMFIGDDAVIPEHAYFSTIISGVCKRPVTDRQDIVRVSATDYCLETAVELIL